MTISAVQVLPGPGIVGRFGDVLLWAEEGDGGGGAAIARLVALARSIADGTNLGQIGGQVAEVLRADPRAVAALVLVAPSGAGLQAIVHGWGRVLADGVDIDGGWADRERAWTNALAAGRGGDVLRVPSPGSVLALRRGTSPGGGAAVLLAAGDAGPPAAPPPAAAPGAPPPPAPATPSPPAPATPSPPAPATPSPLGPPVPDAGPAPAPTFEQVDLGAAPPGRGPLPIGSGGGKVTSPGPVTVKGVVCGRGHFNNPVAVVCATCGAPMSQASRILQDGPRPPLGTLVLDDGTTFGLDSDYVVGSAPEADAGGGQAARPVVVRDPTGQVAPLHAEVRLAGWDVLLVARAPTFVLAPGTRQWTPAPPDQPSPLPVGARVAVGQRTFVIA